MRHYLCVRCRLVPTSRSLCLIGFVRLYVRLATYLKVRKGNPDALTVFPATESVEASSRQVRSTLACIIATWCDIRQIASVKKAYNIGAVLKRTGLGDWFNVGRPHALKSHRV
uniref:Uncharacterized protein n=1 Tax=Pararge aegeria TaxID=116150 RepID=S4PN38_9NEOP